jgi:hypothetical protein
MRSTFLTTIFILGLSGGTALAAEEVSRVDHRPGGTAEISIDENLDDHHGPPPGVGGPPEGSHVPDGSRPPPPGDHMGEHPPGHHAGPPPHHPPGNPHGQRPGGEGEPPVPKGVDDGEKPVVVE